MKPLATVYSGDADGNATVNGKRLQPRFDLRNHSPTGFAHGYGGSGPSQLSLAILADFLIDDARALSLYQPFKWRVVAQLPRDTGWTLSGEQVRDVVLVLEEEMKGRTR